MKILEMLELSAIFWAVSVAAPWAQAQWRNRKAMLKAKWEQILFWYSTRQRVVSERKMQRAYNRALDLIPPDATPHEIMDMWQVQRGLNNIGDKELDVRGARDISKNVAKTLGLRRKVWTISTIPATLWAFVRAMLEKARGVHHD